MIKHGRLKWTGHSVRISSDKEVPKSFMEEEVYRVRRVGGPKLRWTDGVSEDGRKLLYERNWEGCCNK